MNVVFALIGVSMVLLILIAAALLWAIRSGQFEDMQGPAWRVVIDDDRPHVPPETNVLVETAACRSRSAQRTTASVQISSATSKAVTTRQNQVGSKYETGDI
jgi:cbb3-type cytochrome oxidase maturation protein